MLDELPALACDLNALTPQQREQHAANTQSLFATITAVQPLPDGWAFSLRDDAEVLPKLAAFITLERLCCPFLRFTLRVEPQSAGIWLHLTGQEGVKDFLAAEFGAVIPSA
jgi:hypothetical protein